jgi:putative peptidoglycan lipid II flippase
LFLKSSAIFSILTFVSRIFGFIRDVLIAAYFGTGVYADAFNIAFKLPNFFRNIFAEGAFSAAFVPLFSGKLSAEGKKKAIEFAGNILTILTVILIVLIVLFEIFMPFVIMGLAPGFEADAHKFNLTVYLTKITTPYLFFISLVTFYACILNSINKFAAMAFSPVILNIAMIAALYYLGNTQTDKVVVAAWAVFVGGLLQLIFILWPIIRRGVWPSFRFPSFTGDVKKFFKNIIPAVMGSGVTQINLWIGTIIATTIPGAVSMIYYVDRVVQLPISLIGVSIGIVILPSLSRHFKLKNKEQAIHTQNRALEIALLFSLPCTVALFVISEPLIYILFQRGAFKAADTLNTSPALVTLAIGIPAYVMNKIMVPAFFAVEDTKTPVKISIVCMIINVTGNLILIRYLSYVGITLATAIAAWVNIILLFVFAYRKEIFKFDKTFKNKSLKIILSSGFLYVFLEAVSGLCHKYIYCEGWLSLLVFMAVVVGSGLVYFYSLYITSAYTLEELKELF